MPPRAARARRYTQGPHVYAVQGIFRAYLPPDEPGGRPARKSLGTRDRREAERMLGEILAGRRDEGAPQESARESDLVTVVARYLAAPHGWTPRTARSAKARAEAFLDWCERRDITLPSQIKGDDVQDWTRGRLKSGAKHATINRDVMVIRKMLTWAAHPDRGLCAETPFARAQLLREDRRERAPIIPSPAEVRRVVEMIASNGHQRPPVQRGREKPTERRRATRNVDPKAEARIAALYVAASLATGARISELGELTADQIHKGAWIVPPSKGHAERALKLSGDVERAMRELVALLSTTKARNGRGVTLNERWALDLLAWACPAAGVEPFKPHDLRRTFATECRRAGLPITHIRDLMGHKDTQTTERYLGRYRDDADVEVPTPLALRDLVTDAPENVVALKGRKR